VITFAVVGRNEAGTVERVVREAFEATRPGDRVWFVDSDSSDGSADLAGRLGAELIHAPAGKGRAMAAAVERCDTSHICFLDADLVSTTQPVALALREGLERTGASMIVADFDWRGGPGVRSHVVALWRPLAGELFPEALAIAPRFPLSGFRVLEIDLAGRPLPPGFGVEAHLNVRAAVEGRRIATVDVGEFVGAVRRQPALSTDMATAIFDLAEAHGRLDAELRPRWEAWVEEVDAVIASRPPNGGPLGDWRARLAAAARRPRPPARADRAA
jgi:glucosyl-3-phosphoglycerate synthase